MTLAEAKTYSPDELELCENAVNYELEDGYLVERHMGSESSAIAMAIGAVLLNFVKPRRLGHVFTTDCGYLCFPEGNKKLRKPDASFIARGRLPGNRPPTGYLRIAPDLVIEVLSPGDAAVQVEKKVQEYLNAGVKLIWIVTPDTKSVRIHRPTTAKLGPVSQLSESDTITGEEVLPGFECAVREFFDI